MPKVSPEHLEARRRQILDAARATFARHGYEGATVARLEDATGLSRGAIFNYFPSKWDLFYALAEEDHRRGAELWLAEGFGAVVRWLLEQSPDWIGVYLEIHRMLRTNPRLRERWLERNPELDMLLLAKLEEQQRTGELRHDVPAEDIGRFLGLVMDGLVLHVGAGLTFDADVLLRLVVGAIGPQ